MIKILMVVLFFVFVFPVEILAAELKHIEGQNGAPNVFFMSGIIEIGDSKRLYELVKKHPDTKKMVFHNSLGGNYGESLIMSFIIRDHGIDTYVLRGSKCVSGCAFAWVGGKRRVLQDGGTILFHRPYQEGKEGLPVDLKLGLAWYTGQHKIGWKMYDDLLKLTDKNKLIKLTPEVANRWGLQYWRAGK